MAALRETFRDTNGQVFIFNRQMHKKRAESHPDRDSAVLFTFFYLNFSFTPMFSVTSRGLWRERSYSKRSLNDADGFVLRACFR